MPLDAKDDDERQNPDVYEAETRVGSMPASILDALRDQGFDESRAPTRPPAPLPGHRPPGASSSEVPRAYQTAESDDDDDAATRVHKDGHKVALGARESIERAPDTTTAPNAPKPPPRPAAPTPLTAPPPPKASTQPLSPPAVASAPPPMTSTAPALHAPPLPPAPAPAQPAPPPDASWANGPPMMSAPPPMMSAPPAFAPSFHPPAAPFGAREAPMPMPPQAQPPVTSNVHWIAIVIVSFVVTLTVVGALLSRFL